MAAARGVRSSAQALLAGNDDEDPPDDDLFKLAISILIAVVTVVSALVAWRISGALDEAGDLNAAGVNAALTDTDARVRNTLTAFRQYEAYTAYQRYRQLADIIASEQRKTNQTADEKALLDRYRREARNLSLTLEGNGFFTTRYLDNNLPAGYDIERQIGELTENSTQRKDVQFDNRFDEADAAREAANRLTKVLLVLAASLIFLTISYGARKRVRRQFGTVGFVLLIAGGAAALMTGF